MLKLQQEKYWSVQNTEDGRYWNELFQVERIYTKDAVESLAKVEISGWEKYRQFYRIVEKSRNVLK